MHNKRLHADAQTYVLFVGFAALHITTKSSPAWALVSRALYLKLTEEKCLLNCSGCESEMVPGEVALKYTGWGVFFFGASYKHLFFKPKKGGPKNKQVILENNHVATAYKCPKCGATTILSNGINRSLVHW